NTNRRQSASEFWEQLCLSRTNDCSTENNNPPMPRTTPRPKQEALLSNGAVAHHRPDSSGCNATSELLHCSTPAGPPPSPKPQAASAIATIHWVRGVQYLP